MELSTRLKGNSEIKIPAFNFFSLMNTYDEYAQQEYGTHQEFWFQFNYYYDFTALTPSTTLNNLCDGHEDFDCYQAPNHLFNSFEVKKS